jgi:hypothetical protein
LLKDCNHPPIEGTKICPDCPKPDDWQTHARCLDFDPDLFFCEADDAPKIMKAVKICMGCDIRGFCLEEGFKNKWGIWGSFTAEERLRLRKAFPLPDDAKQRRKIIRLIAHRL